MGETRLARYGIAVLFVATTALCAVVPARAAKPNRISS